MHTGKYEIKLSTFEKLEQPWKDLENTPAIPTIFQTFDWINCWWKYNKKNKNLYLITAYRNNELMGILPIYTFVMKVKGIPLFKIARLLGAWDSDYNAIIIKSNYEEETLSALLSFVKRIDWNIFWLSDVHSDTSTASLLPSLLKAQKYSFTEKKHTPCPYIELPEDFDVYKKSLSKNTRQNMTKFVNRVEKLEGISHQVIKDPPMIEDAMKSFINLHQKRWNTEGQSGALADQTVQNFHIDVAQQLNKHLHLEQLLHNDKVIASTYSYDYNNTRYLYLPGMEQR